MQRRGFLHAVGSAALSVCGGCVAGPGARREASGPLAPAPPPAPSPPAPLAPLAPLAAATFAARLDRVRALTRDAGAGAALVTSGTTSFAYLTGKRVERSERLIALLVPVSGEPVLVAPSFEVERMRRSLVVRATLRGWEESASPYDLLRDAFAARPPGAPPALLVEPHTEYGTAQALAAHLPGIALLDGAAAFGGLRVVKDEEELVRLRRAIAITTEVFERAFAALRPGVADREVASSIERAFEARGVTGYALVQFGPLSALPHGSPTGAALPAESAVLIDGGCQVDGYWSDLTRTRWFGASPPAEFRRVVDVVRAAQQAGIAAARPGIAAQEIDRAARGVIAQAGLGAFFTHRTGHGLGMDGHEPLYLVEGNAAPLVPGCVFTVEPGVYLPDRFGVRIEDDVVCTARGAAVLAGA